MRLISNVESVCVSGGVAMSGDEGQISVIPDFWGMISGWFSELLGGSSGGSSSAIEPVFQTITISAARWTEADEVRYQIEQGIAGIPSGVNCSFNYQINPSSTTISASATVALTPSGTAGTSQMSQTATKTWSCKP